jgi:UDP-glucose 4-epimerase
MLVLVEKNKSFSTINVASGQILSVNELLKKLLKISGSKIKIKYNKSKKNMTPDRILDNSKLVQDFDWRPKFSIDDGLKLTYNWMKSQLL